jgi:two-component system nitrate/nitrite response regulator NarL
LFNNDELTRRIGPVSPARISRKVNTAMAADTSVRPTSIHDSRIRLVIVGAQPVVRVGLRHLLEQSASLQIVGEASCTEEAAALVEKEQPHVILLDPDSEDLSLQTITALTERSAAKVLVFTAATEPTLHIQAVALGAVGVVQKHHSGDTLTRAIGRVAAGEVWLERRTTLIGSGLKNDAIAEHLSLSQATVRNHLTSILSKLELSDRFELVFYAAAHGLVEPRAGTQALRFPRSHASGSKADGRTAGGRSERAR